MNKQRFPQGWDEKRVEQVIAHYESQSEDEEWAEIKSFLEAENMTLIAVPNDLVPQVRAIISRSQPDRSG